MTEHPYRAFVWMALGLLVTALLFSQIYPDYSSEILTALIIASVSGTLLLTLTNWEAQEHTLSRVLNRISFAAVLSAGVTAISYQFWPDTAERIAIVVLVVGILGAGAGGVFTLARLVLGFIGFQNEANMHENGIKAQYSQNQNVYDNGWKKVKEMAHVPEMYAGDLEQLYRATLEGRYGENGSQAVIQFIQEQNPNLDASTYRQVQQAIEIFRNGFQQAQRELVAKRNTYENYLTTNTPSRFYNFISGGSYPKIDLTLYDIVASERTGQDFRTKRGGPIQLRRN